MSVAPSKATSVHVKPLESEQVFNLCSNALLLETAMAFHSAEPFDAEIVSTAAELLRLLNCFTAAKDSEVGTLGAHVREETISSLMTSELAMRFSQQSSHFESVLGSLPSCALPSDWHSSFLWAGQLPIVLDVKEGKNSASKPGQGQMDISLAIKFSADFLTHCAKRGMLPVAFIELTKGNISQKANQAFCTAVGCMQHLHGAGCVFPILGVTLSADKICCAAYCPDEKRKLSCVQIGREDVSADSLCRLIRAMLFWGVGVQRFMRGPHWFQMQPAQNVVFSGAFR